jgi:hypothetical protein
MSREDARTTLRNVTEVMHLNGREEQKFAYSGVMDEKASAENLSILEKDW